MTEVDPASVTVRRGAVVASFPRSSLGDPALRIGDVVENWNGRSGVVVEVDGDGYSVRVRCNDDTTHTFAEVGLRLVRRPVP